MVKTKKKPAGKKTITMSNAPRQRITASLNARSYDAAATSRHNELHWLYADASDADFWIRQDLPTVRNRARYEIKNNSYAEGIVDTLVNELIGTGPDLQFDSDEGREANEEVEEKFYLWTQICDIEGRQTFEDIIQLVGTRQQCESGEGLLALLNGRPNREWVRARPEPLLRLRAIEPDQLCNPYGLPADEKLRDGIEFDEDGRPAFYYILKQHPGAKVNFGLAGDYDKIAASQIIHIYRLKRPGQSRGMPWITPSLPLFAHMRRFTLATIQNAESVANTTGTLEAESTGDDSVEPMDEVEIPRNALLTLPPGRKMNTVKPEHPATTYKMFKAEIINEIARCVSMPYNIAAANSSEYNYASGRLDHQSFKKFKKTIRNWLERHLINRVMLTWLREGLLIPGFFKFYKGTNIEKTILQWNWPGDEHVDPKKEADGQDTRLDNNSTNLKIEYSAQGRDWRRELKQRAEELAYCRELGIPLKTAKPKINNDNDNGDENGSKKK